MKSEGRIPKSERNPKSDTRSAVYVHFGRQITSPSSSLFFKASAKEEGTEGREETSPKNSCLEPLDVSLPSRRPSLLPLPFIRGEGRGEGSSPWRPARASSNLNGLKKAAISYFGFGFSGLGLLLATVLIILPSLALAQPKVPAPAATPIERAEGERLAHELIANLLSQRPSQSSSNAAVINVRDAAHHVRESSVSFQIVPTSTNYLTIYEVLPSGAGPGGRTLTITHAGESPNVYLLTEPSRGGVPGKTSELAGPQLMSPFAGSDFWVADLGLDFLHWPQQRVLKKEMKKGQFCAVLQSVNPHPENGGYARIVSWIAINHPEDTVIVHADGYDTAGKLIKEFDPKKLEKVNGLWQLEEMEMINRQTNSRTTIEFKLGDKP